MLSKDKQLQAVGGVRVYFELINSILASNRKHVIAGHKFSYFDVCYPLNNRWCIGYVAIAKVNPFRRFVGSNKQVVFVLELPCVGIAMNKSMWNSRKRSTVDLDCLSGCYIVGNEWWCFSHSQYFKEIFFRVPHFFPCQNIKEIYTLLYILKKFTNIAIDACFCSLAKK